MTDDKAPQPTPKPHPPGYSSAALHMAEKYHLDPWKVQDLIDKGVVKL
jgi:hypothetical protein